MLGKLLLLGLAPLGLIAATISNNTPNPILDYAGLALAAAVVGFLCRYLCKITKQHREERKEIVTDLKNNDSKHSDELKKIIEKDIESRDRLSAALENRACLAKVN